MNDTSNSAQGAGGNGRSLEPLILGVVLFIAPLILLFVSRDAAFADLGGAFSPMFFPTIILWGWAITAGIALAVDVMRRTTDGRAPINANRWGQIVAVSIAMAVFVFAFTRLGFVLSGIAFTLAVLLILGLRKPVLIALFSILVPVGLFVMFHHMLGLPLPTSPFSYRF